MLNPRNPPGALQGCWKPFTTLFLSLPSIFPGGAGAWEVQRRCQWSFSQEMTGAGSQTLEDSKAHSQCRVSAAWASCAGVGGHAQRVHSEWGQA